MQQIATSGLFDRNIIRSLVLHFLGMFQVASRRTGHSSGKSSGHRGLSNKNKKPPANGHHNGHQNAQARMRISDLFKNAPMALQGLNDLLYKVGKANAKIPNILNAPKSKGFVQAVPVAVFGSVKDSIRAYFEMFGLALTAAGWKIEYCPRVRMEELSVTSQHLYQVPVWFSLDLQHNLLSMARKERVDLGQYNTHPIATLAAMMLNISWLESFGQITDGGIKVGGAEIATVVLPGLRQSFCPTKTHQEIAIPHCVTVQVNPHKKIAHIGLRPVNAVPCGSMLIPLVVP